MVASIVVTGRYSIGQNASGKIDTGEQKLSVLKEIPFVRYRFEQFSDADVEYIKNMMEQFKSSTHVAEMTLKADTVEEANRFGDLGIAKFLYIKIGADVASTGTISEELAQQMANVLNLGVHFDRFMLKDESDSINYKTIKEIVKKFKKAFGIAESDIGICSSPFSFEDMQCLSSVKARELMSIYNPTSEVAIPTANHQSMQCCGCIRYFIIDHDVEAPSDSAVRKKSAKNSDGEQKPKEKKKTNKQQLMPGLYTY